MRKMILPVVISILLSTQTLCLQSNAEEPSANSKNQIVFVADVSGSLAEIDQEKKLADALKLGVDFAPYGSEIALITINDKIISETGLTTIDNEDSRAGFKNAVNQIEYKGNTNFGVGLTRALEILEAADSGGANQRIILLGDNIEGGYILNSTAQFEAEATTLDALADKAKSQDIPMDLVFVRDAPAGSITAPHLESLAKETGGTVMQVESPNEFPKAVEDIYLASYSYLKTAISVALSSEDQLVNIPMPTDHVNRARIYVSASKSVGNTKASYAGAALDGEFNRSYSMIWLERPARDGVQLSLGSGTGENANIYLLLEYTPKLYVSAAHDMVIPEGAKEAVQVTTLTAEIQDILSGQPLLTADFPVNVTYSVHATGTDGEPVELQDSPGNPYGFTFQPASYGTYSIAAELSVGDMKISVPAETISIQDIRPDPEPVNWPLIIAITIVCLLILSALIISLRIKKKEAEHQGAAEMSSDYRFHGKLSVYAVMLEGGNRELRPFDFRLHTLPDKRITLRNILDSIGEKDTYKGAENILFLVGPEESIIIRNNSQAAIRVMGRNYDYRSTTQLFYDQKCYIIFEKDENELEIKYCKVKEEDPAPMQFNIRSRRVHS